MIEAPTTPTRTRRETIIRGHTVIVENVNGIETAKHNLCCEWCRRKLRPRYETTRATVMRRRAAEMSRGLPTDEHGAPARVDGAAKWDEKRRMWMQDYRGETITGRRFFGHAGKLRRRPILRTQLRALLGACHRPRHRRRRGTVDRREDAQGSQVSKGRQLARVKVARLPLAPRGLIADSRRLPSTN
jgi:hypothetical protein